MQELLLVTGKAGFRQLSGKLAGGRCLIVTIPTKDGILPTMYNDDMPPRLVQTMTMEKTPANWELDARTRGFSKIDGDLAPRFPPGASLFFLDDVILENGLEIPWF